jgi:hypothetical protein
MRTRWREACKTGALATGSHRLKAERAGAFAGPDLDAFALTPNAVGTQGDPGPVGRVAAGGRKIRTASPRARG